MKRFDILYKKIKRYLKKKLSNFAYSFFVIDGKMMVGIPSENT